MPTVSRIDGLRVVIWPDDHGPAHVHVIGPAMEAVFKLRCPDGPPELRGSYAFKLADLRRIEAALTDMLARPVQEMERDTW